MNRRERKRRWKEHLQREDRLERKYVRPMASLLRFQIRSFKIWLKKYGAGRAEKMLNDVVYDTNITRLLERMYKDAVFVFAKAEYRSVVALSVVKKESAAFGFNEEWSTAVIDFLSRYLLDRAVIPVTSYTKKLIMDVMEEGQLNGWGVDRILYELGEIEEMSEYRARRIIRTELAIANNFAQNLVTDSVEFETDEEWITARDHRVRSSHRKMDGVIIHTGEKFSVDIIRKKQVVGEDRMSGPGDPTASAGNVINCRCTKALVPRRDENDELIMKPKRLINF